MNHPATSQSTETSNDARKMGKWARSYAQNRSLGVVVSLVIFLILSAAIGGPSYFGGMAYRDGQWIIFWVCIAILIVALAATVYLSVPWWGGKLLERITKQIYAGEGNVQITPTCSRGKCWLMGIIGIAFGGCIVASVELGFLGYIPEQYMQPVSAIYSVPFLLTLLFVLRPAVGFIMFLWPALYTLHAVLILAGVPILFSRPWESLNMLIPTVGYGLLAGLLSHIYSRFALWRLRSVARGSFQDEAGEDRQP